MTDIPDIRTEVAGGRSRSRRRLPATGALIAAALTLALAAPPAAWSSPGDAVLATPVHVDNPYEGATGYVNPEWSARAEAEPGGVSISGNPTAVWLDRIAAVEGTSDRMGLRAHLDAALAQGAGYAQFVIHNLPGRDCVLQIPDGELGQREIGRYRTEFIDPIATILSDPKYAGLRIVTIIEVRALPSLVVNTGSRPTATAGCNTMISNGNYVAGVQYALNRLHPIPNVYTYVDVANHAWTGRDDTFGPVSRLVADTIRGTTAGLSSVDGFITNTADYAALREPFLTADATTRESTWLNGNRYVDELSFAQAFREQMILLGFPAGIGMLIDTSRNGWGGPGRPVAASTDPDLNTRVDASRVDRRAHQGNWCNQAGAGIGERPRANPEPGIDAYVWAKPPGESDGTMAPRDTRAFNSMCDPTYSGNLANGNNTTNVLPGGPERGEWFAAHFRQLLDNAYPPVTSVKRKMRHRTHPR